jgi:serine O-acetyltransferase
MREVLEERTDRLPGMSLVSRLIYARRGPFRRLVKELLALYCVEVPSTVEVGPGLRVMHRGFGTVIHGATVLGSNVTLFHGVTIGRSLTRGNETTKFERVVVEDGVVIYPGAKIVGGPGVTTIAAGTIIGANSVVIGSTSGGTWAGVPARQLRTRATGSNPGPS